MFSLTLNNSHCAPPEITKCATLDGHPWSETSPSHPNEKKSRQKLTLASVRLRHPSKSRQNCVPRGKGTQLRGGRASKDVRLVSGSWPADSAIKRSYTPASREARATTPWSWTCRNSSLDGPVQRNNRAKQKERNMLRRNALRISLSLSFSVR